MDKRKANGQMDMSMGGWTDGHDHEWMDMSMVDGQMKDRQPLKFVADDGTNKNFFFLPSLCFCHEMGLSGDPAPPCGCPFTAGREVTVT